MNIDDRKQADSELYKKHVLLSKQQEDLVT